MTCILYMFQRGRDREDRMRERDDRDRRIVNRDREDRDRQIPPRDHEDRIREKDERDRREKEKERDDRHIRDRRDDDRHIEKKDYDKDRYVLHNQVELMRNQTKKNYILNILICKLQYTEKTERRFVKLIFLFVGSILLISPFFATVTEMIEIAIGKMTRADREKRRDASANTNPKGRRIEIVTSGTKGVR